jgi:hypothetical protein
VKLSADRERLAGNLSVDPNMALAVVDLKAFKGYQFKGEAELLDEGNIYNDVVCYLQTLPMKLPDPQYVVRIKIKEKGPPTWTGQEAPFVKDKL